MSNEIIDSIELLKKFKNEAKIIGFKQVSKMLNSTPTNIKCVILAKNIDDEIMEYIKAKSTENYIDLLYVNHSGDLGRFAKIDVPASVLAILK